MREEIDLNMLGGVVGWLSNSGWRLSTWSGETITVWAKFKKSDERNIVEPMKDEIVEAYAHESDSDDVDEGFVAAICFIKDPASV